MHLLFVLAAFAIAAAAPMMMSRSADISADAEMLEQWTADEEASDPVPGLGPRADEGP